MPPNPHARTYVVAAPAVVTAQAVTALASAASGGVGLGNRAVVVNCAAVTAIDAAAVAALADLAATVKSLLATVHLYNVPGPVLLALGDVANRFHSVAPAE